ncbi:MAG: hypothetical protein ABUT20_08380 [Bacteroidota bacterium]
MKAGSYATGFSFGANEKLNANLPPGRQGQQRMRKEIKTYLQDFFDE